MYRGREGQWAFFLHRISGIAILLYLLIHVLNISAAMWGEEASKSLFAIFHIWFFRLGLLGVIGAVLYHALNGLRIILMDFTGWGVKYQRELWYGVWGLFVLFYVPALVKIVPEIVRDITGA
ncbi:succinate dehydrogenase, cytochrome b556 subunit [Calidithermus chliarophilus]|uniref:succinate dehydrogenase, cytochrome b556 subunit n=1 Tax=Calidithermus chliarophilus TaxID=52023 RepID=UPI0004188625|nr:succinate dehydrogenase, cytochrome b556 subunit [Calidithermus chliarophilus]